MPEYIPTQGVITSVDNPAAQDQSPEEKEAVQLVEKLFIQAKRSREKQDNEWMDYFRYFRGKQWKDKRPTYRHSEVLNFIYAELINVLVLLTDVRPRIETVPEDPTDLEFSEIINQILISKWDQYQYARTLAENILDSAIYGTGIGSVPWYKDLVDGLGDYLYESIDPFHFYPDPNARSSVNDRYCKYTVVAEPTDIQLIREEYPDKGEMVKPDLSDIAIGGYEPEDTDYTRYKSPTDNRILSESYQTHKGTKPNQVLKFTCFTRCNDTEEDKFSAGKDQITGLDKHVYQERLKYPNGRKLVVANGILLEDKANEYMNGKFPYARLVNQDIPRQFWGISEVQQIKSPQDIINKTISYVLDVLIIMGNPIWIVDTSAGIETDNLTNQPGLVVEKSPGAEVRREQGIPIQPYVLETLKYFVDNVFSKLGSTGEVTRGISPSPDASGVSIELLQEAAQTKIRAKSRNVEYFLKDIGELMVERIMQFYKLPRIIRITNNENATKYFKFNIEDKPDEAGNVTKVATVQEFLPDASGQMLPQYPRQMEVKSRLDVKMSVGSSLPFAKAKKEKLADKLLERGIIDIEEYLTQIEYPNKEKILERLKSQPPAQPAQPGVQSA